MTTAEANRLISMIGQIETSRLVIQVRILDVKETYGKVRYLVTPVAGSGQAWKENVQFVKEEESDATE